MRLVAKADAPDGLNLSMEGMTVPDGASMACWNRPVVMCGYMYAGNTYM